ncbi:MAG: oxidoreductase [Patulibacter sp.]|nr:oxidoreductase [Patulibacter sp.]
MERTVELRPGAGGPVPDDALGLVVADRRSVAEGVVELVLRRPDGETLPAWEAGAHVDVELPSGELRQYSLCGDRGDTSCWRIGVLREADGRGGSRWIHDELQVGDVLRASVPRNNFPLVDAPEYLFVAGGIGVTPLLPMVAAVAASGAPWSMVYAGRRQATMAFCDELSPFGEQVRVWCDDRDGQLDLRATLAAVGPDAAVYCCGPEPLLSAIEDACAAAGRRAPHVERFRPREGALDGVNVGFEVELAASGTTLTVAPDQSIAEALDEAGIDVPTSCREGTCGTCETAVLEGVPDHRDSFLSEEEQADNASMMICCSRSAGPRLVLDL